MGRRRPQQAKSMARDAQSPAGAVTRSRRTKLDANANGSAKRKPSRSRSRKRAKSHGSVVPRAGGGTSAGEEKILTIPTILTLARVVAIPFVALAYTRTGPSAVAWCTTLYVLACFTDWLDGYIARKTGTFSKFGAFLDPVSDKLMVTVILILVTYSSPPEGLCATIPAIVPLSAGVIICREVAMSALREWAASAGSEVRSAVAVNSLGKWKTALQMTALGFLLACKEGCHNNMTLQVLSYLGPIFLLLSALLATYSFLVYFKGIWKFMVNP